MPRTKQEVLPEGKGMKGQDHKNGKEGRVTEGKKKRTKQKGVGQNNCARGKKKEQESRPKIKPAIGHKSRRRQFRDEPRKGL